MWSVSQTGSIKNTLKVNNSIIRQTISFQHYTLSEKLIKLMNRVWVIHAMQPCSQVSLLLLRWRMTKRWPWERVWHAMLCLCCWCYCCLPDGSVIPEVVQLRNGRRNCSEKTLKEILFIKLSNIVCLFKSVNVSELILFRLFQLKVVQETGLV